MVQLMRCVGGCLPIFLAALLVDVVGLVVIFVGIFANLRHDGRFYGDFLIYTGSLVLFFSLALWLMWYVFNVPVKKEREEGEDGEGGEEKGGWRSSSSVMKLARRLSERLSQRMKDVETPPPSSSSSSSSSSSLPPHKASRVGWGPSSTYINHGYDTSMDGEVENTPDATSPSS